MSAPSKATAEHIRNVLQRYVDLMTAGDHEAIVALYADNASVEDPVGSEPRRGKEQIRELYKNASGRVRLELEGRVRAVGNVGAAAMLAYPAGMDGMVVDTIDIMTFDDNGLITSMRAYWSPDTIHPK
ncbi:MAG: nuclear transport factor 2 family protein [Deltaproteobacteria bacterium]|nr:nuclear transport factor 2 family protein [Deltaproteobacteria bacterium]